MRSEIQLIEKVSFYLYVIKAEGFDFFISIYYDFMFILSQNYNMNKCSFENGCYERAVWSCNCVNPYLYICDRHIKRHLRAPGEHKTESTIVELTSRQRTEFLPRLKKLLKYFKGYRKSIIDNSKILIECIEKETRKTLMNITNLKKIAVDLICERSISKENYERIKSIPSENQIPIRYEVENIKENLKTLCKFDDSEGIKWKECNEIIFSRDAGGGLQSIDLNTFNLSQLYLPLLTLYLHSPISGNAIQLKVCPKCWSALSRMQN